MYADVYLRRCRGQRLRPPDENAQTPLVGVLQLAHVGMAGSGYAVLTLQALGNQTQEGELLRLYEPVIIGLGNGWLSFRGFESFPIGEGAVSFVQEWRCKVTDALMAEVTAWLARPQEVMYPAVFFDALRVKIREDADRRVPRAQNGIDAILALLPTIRTPCSEGLKRGWTIT